MPKSKTYEKLKVLEGIVPLSAEEAEKLNEIVANMMKGKWVDQAIRPKEVTLDEPPNQI